MIKRLIFDLDNTLINWEDSYYTFAVKNVCSDLKLNNYEIILPIVIKSMDSYESIYEIFSVDNMINLLNENSSEYEDIYFTKDFVEKLIYYFSLCIPEKIDSSLIETLEYLHEKYDLVILTNWFEKQQTERLENANILKYFSHVYGTDKIKIKPNKEAFETAIGDFLPEECVMIGDNFYVDVQGALNSNLNAVFYNRKNIDIPKENLSKKLQCINSISDLQTIF